MKSLRDIYQYRQIASRCERGGELSIDEIQLLTVTDNSREKASGRVMLRGPRVADWVEVTELGPSSLLCSACPWMEEGQAIEIIFEEDDGQESYRFKAVVSWTRDDGDDLDVCFNFTGAAVHMRKGPKPRSREQQNDLLTRFAA